MYVRCVVIRGFMFPVHTGMNRRWIHYYWDNAVAESFFGIYKTELVYDEIFEDKQDVLSGTFEYIEHYYTRKRRHGTIGYLSPVEFETHFKR